VQHSLDHQPHLLPAYAASLRSRRSRPDVDCWLKRLNVSETTVPNNGTSVDAKNAAERLRATAPRRLGLAHHAVRLAYEQRSQSPRRTHLLADGPVSRMLAALSRTIISFSIARVIAREGERRLRDSPRSAGATRACWSASRSANTRSEPQHTILFGAKKIVGRAPLIKPGRGHARFLKAHRSNPRSANSASAASTESPCVCDRVADPGFWRASYGHR